MKKNKQNIILTILLILVMFLITVLIVLLIKWRKMQIRETTLPEQVTKEEAEETETELETESENETEIIISEKPDIIYPAPTYDFNIEEVTVEIPGISRKYAFAWVSDVHMISDLEPADDVMAENMETIQQRFDLLFRDKEGVPSAEIWPEIVKYLNYHYKELDGILLGGDMMDYCSKNNMDAFMKEYEQLDDSVPILYIRADHDYGFWYGGDVLTEEDTHEMHQEIDEDDLHDKCLDFDEFKIIGVNASTKDMPSYQLDMIDDWMKDDKPVIIVTHVPYASKVDESLEILSMKVRNKVYYWGGGSYIPNDVTSQFLDQIYDKNTKVCQVLAGHLHAEWDGMITEQVPQHIFTPAYEGCIGWIYIVPAKEDD